MKEIETKLDYQFKDESLLKTALTHSSYANEMKKEGAKSNERLEFLGDAVLGMLVARYLYITYPDMPEGRMTKVRSSLVCEQNLVEVGEKLGLGQHILLGKGERTAGGRERPALLADAVEAVLAAVTLDGGLDEAERIVQRYIIADLDHIDQLEHDYKTMVQEYVQRKSGQTFTYDVIDEQGPDHLKTFTVRLMIDDADMGRGSGRTKKEAEQAAAADAIKKLQAGTESIGDTSR